MAVVTRYGVSFNYIDSKSRATTVTVYISSATYATYVGGTTTAIDALGTAIDALTDANRKGTNVFQETFDTTVAAPASGLRGNKANIVGISSGGTTMRISIPARIDSKFNVDANSVDIDVSTGVTGFADWDAFVTAYDAVAVSIAGDDLSVLTGGKLND